MTCSSQINIDFNECREFSESRIYPYKGMIVFNKEIGYLKCIKIRDSGINTWRKCDANGTFLKEERNEKGNIIDYGVRLIRIINK